MKIKILFFVIAIIIAKAIASMEIGFLIAIAMMTIGAVVVCRLSGELVITGTVALFFSLFSVPLPSQFIPYYYIMLILLGLLMALAIIVVLAREEEKAEIRHTPMRRKAITA